MVEIKLNKKAKETAEAIKAKQPELPVLICTRCNYIWSYSGKSTYFTSCPKCRNSNVHVEKHKIA